jgi:hypothetical protein
LSSVRTFAPSKARQLPDTPRRHEISLDPAWRRNRATARGHPDPALGHLTDTAERRISAFFTPF